MMSAPLAPALAVTVVDDEPLAQDVLADLSSGAGKQSPPERAGAGRPPPDAAGQAELPLGNHQPGPHGGGARPLHGGPFAAGPQLLAAPGPGRGPGPQAAAVAQP